MDEEHVNELRRLGALSPRIGRRPRQHYTLREQYGEDIFALETVLVFRRGGQETRAAVKVAEGLWRVTGCHWLRRWDGMLRTVGHDYEISQVE